MNTAPNIRYLSPWLTRFLEKDTVTAEAIVAQKTESWHANYQNELDRANTIPEVMRILRQWRMRFFAKMAWQDLVMGAELETILTEISHTADFLLQTSLDWLIKNQTKVHRIPLAPFVVIGMGKLGGQELNVSSDVDLIFAWDDSHYDENSEEKWEMHDKLTRLAQTWIKLLHEITAEGFVFRVDTLLRPFGKAGALLMSFSAMLNYYMTHGREWERYAWVKARTVAGDFELGSVLLQAMQPFIYRKYFDWTVLDSLRELKQKIRGHLLPEDYTRDIKLGDGGIRELEFIVQVFQLMRGGRNANLRANSWFDALNALIEQGLLDADQAEKLKTAYIFLRKVEHRLQWREDQQTQKIPENNENNALFLESFAINLGYENWENLRQALTEHRKFVSDYFAKILITHRENQEKNLPTPEFLAREDIQKLLQYAVPAERAWRILPRVLFRAFLCIQAKNSDHPHKIEKDFAILLSIIYKIARRSTYLVLFDEYPEILYKVCQICRVSPPLANTLAQQPILFDELTNAPPLLTRKAIRDSLYLAWEIAVKAQPNMDLTENFMHFLRHQKQRLMLHIALHEINNAQSLSQISDALSDVADLILQMTFDFAWKSLEEKFGAPTNARYVVIAYGKLGGQELAYGSDLDIVFLYDAPSDKLIHGSGLSYGAFFTKLVQKVVHLLATRTTAGMAYEVDLQLRPSGNSGLLVTQFKRFVAYERNSAWLWEHQALLRARPVAGDSRLAWAFWAAKRRILVSKTFPQIRTHVLQMRQKMRAAFDKNTQVSFDLKHGAGGLVDLEFWVQSLVLENIAAHPNLALLSAHRQHLYVLVHFGVLSEDFGKKMIAAWDALRAAVHGQHLADAKPILSLAELPPTLREHQAFVKTQFSAYFGVT